MRDDSVAIGRASVRPVGTGERVVVKDNRKVNVAESGTYEQETAAVDATETAASTANANRASSAPTGDSAESGGNAASRDAAGEAVADKPVRGRAVGVARPVPPNEPKSTQTTAAVDTAVTGGKSAMAEPAEPGDTRAKADKVVEVESVEPDRAATVAKETATVESGEAAKSATAARTDGDEGGQAPGRPLGAELAALRGALDERTRDLQRVTAEYANYRKRVDRDRALVVEQATGNVLAALLPVLDDLDRAREHGDLNGPFAAVADQLTAALGKFGLTPFGAEGEPFDPKRHEAVTHSTSADVTQPTCVGVMRRGYLLGERLLRAALVAVADPE